LYYILDCNEPLSEEGEALLEIHNNFRVGKIRLWRTGRPLRGEVPGPIEIRFDRFRGYEGPPVELLDLGIPIMSRRMADALTEAGVDNLELFPAKLVHPGSGEAYEYRAYNVIGLVAAADLDKSEWSSYDGRPVMDTSFESLVLDESKVGTQLLFRLAENVNALMIHERVRDHLTEKGIDTLEFIAPEDWSQI